MTNLNAIKLISASCMYSIALLFSFYGASKVSSTEIIGYGAVILPIYIIIFLIAVRSYIYFIKVLNNENFRQDESREANVNSLLYIVPFLIFTLDIVILFLI